MFRNTFTAAVAALTIAGTAQTTPAQAGDVGKAVAIGILGTAVGVIAGAASARAQENAEREAYHPRGGGYGHEGVRRVRAYDGGHEGSFRRVRSYDGGYGGCGFRNSPIFDEYGHRIGMRRVPAC